MAASIFNLCKGIMGAGALSLPASICAIGSCHFHLTIPYMASQRPTHFSLDR
jgi:hypothetical protein